MNQLPTTRLKKLETTIESSFSQAVAALAEIKNDKLYREEGYPSFEEYCQQRWGLKRTQAFYQVKAAEVMDNLNVHNCEHLPANEAQTRPLTGIEQPERQSQAWDDAVKTAPNGKITASHVESVAKKYKSGTDKHSSEEQSLNGSENTHDDVFSKGEVESEKTPNTAQVHKLAVSSKTTEHYTPQNILEAVYNCLGEVDLDPCSDSHTSPNVKARQHHTKEDNGLNQSWEGSVFLNPPFNETRDWTRKLIDSYRGGMVSEAIALTKNDNRTAWYAELMEEATAFCLVRGYTRFGEATGAAAFGVVLWYFGSNPSNFSHYFDGTIGWSFEARF